jgi:hypothetical protein
MQLGEIVQDLMRREGLTFEGVAERVRGQGATNVRYQHIQQLLEFPNRRPRYLPELARAFGMTVEEFLAYKPRPGALRVNESPAPWPTSQALRIDPETIAAALKLVRLAFANLGLEIDQEENAEPLAYAYEYLLGRQESAVTAENVIDFSARLKRKLGESTHDESEGGSRGAGLGDREHGQGRKAV